VFCFPKWRINENGGNDPKEIVFAITKKKWKTLLYLNYFCICQYSLLRNVFHNIKLSAENVYCCYFNGRAATWAFPLELE